MHNQVLFSKNVQEIPSLSASPDLEDHPLERRTEEVADHVLSALPESLTSCASLIPMSEPSSNAKTVDEAARKRLQQNLALESLHTILLKEQHTSQDIRKVSHEIQDLHATIDQLYHVKDDLMKLVYGSDKTEYKLSASLCTQLEELKSHGISLMDDLTPGRKISALERSNVCNRIETEVKRIESKKYDIVTVKAPVLAKLMQLVLEMAKGIVDRQKHLNDTISHNQRQ